MNTLDYEVMAHVFAAHRELGRLCDETIYHADLAGRLADAGLGPIRLEFPLTVSFREFSSSYFLDLVVADRVIYELKTHAKLTPAHDAQLLNYLLLANVAGGKLINFRPSSVESRFVNAPLDASGRRRFAVHGDRAEPFFSLVLDLVADWGTGLETALYLRALTYLLGGEAEVVRLLPVGRGHARLGNQRFHLVAPDTAFVVTSLPTVGFSHQSQLLRLLRLSPLSYLLWVNIALHDVTCTKIDRADSL